MVSGTRAGHGAPTEFPAAGLREGGTRPGSQGSGPSGTEKVVGFLL